MIKIYENIQLMQKAFKQLFKTISCFVILKCVQLLQLNGMLFDLKCSEVFIDRQKKKDYSKTVNFYSTKKYDSICLTIKIA